MTDDPASAEYLAQARRRIAYLRRRQGAWMFLLIGPFIILGAVLKAIGPHDFPPGDYRNEPLFWVAITLFFLVVIGSGMVGSIRFLRRTDDPSLDASGSRDIPRR